jgi:hypothetical protein
MKVIYFCHGYTEEDIIADVKRNKGNASILRQIIKERKNNICQCDLRHPEER